MDLDLDGDIYLISERNDGPSHSHQKAAISSGTALSVRSLRGLTLQGSAVCGKQKTRRRFLVRSELTG